LLTIGFVVRVRIGSPGKMKMGNGKNIYFYHNEPVGKALLQKGSFPISSDFFRP
jgi:hypothetical protein